MKDRFYPILKLKSESKKSTLISQCTGTFADCESGCPLGYACNSRVYSINDTIDLAKEWIKRNGNKSNE